MGLTDLISFNDWVIESVDDEVSLRLVGEYHPEGGLETDQAPVVTDTTTAGSDEPSLQWVSGGSRVWRFRNRFRSKHNLDDIRGKRDDLERLRQRDPNLGRAPRVSVAWGDRELTGFVTSLRTRDVGLWVTGLPKELQFEIEITSAPDVTGSGSSGETQYLHLAAGESFETLGRRYLGSALRGERIRRINPALAGRPERAGDRVKVLEREHPAMRGAVLPLGVPFLDPDRTGWWQPIVDALGASRGATERGLPYQALPEVLAGLVSEVD